MKTKLLLTALLLIVISGRIATPSSMNPMSEWAIGWYDPNTDNVHCFEKWECLHEVVHKFDYNGTLFPTISSSKRFREAVKLYREGIGEDTVYLDRFIYNFPGVYNDFAGDGWGGYQELFAEIYTVTEMKGISIPKEFVQFYDRGVINKMWKQYPNIMSRL